jgi:hypothetical protein
MVDDYRLIQENRQGRGNHTIAMMHSLEVKISAAQAIFVDHQQSQASHVLHECSNTLNDDTFLDDMQRRVNISSARLEMRPKNLIIPEQLTKTWNIDLEAAKHTCESMTQSTKNGSKLETILEFCHS